MPVKKSKSSTEVIEGSNQDDSEDDLAEIKTNLQSLKNLFEEKPLNNDAIVLCLETTIETLNQKFEQLKENRQTVELEKKSLNLQRENMQKELAGLELSRQNDVYDNSAETRKEEQELMSKTRIDKALYLVSKIITEIEAKNGLKETFLRRENKTEKDLNAAQRKFFRLHGDWSFIVKNSRNCQQRIIKIQKILINLVKKAGGVESLSPFDERMYIGAFGLLKFLLLRTNLFGGDFIDTLEATTLELQRLFSALLASITALTSLDEELGAPESFAKVSEGYVNFSLEQKQQFMKTHFEASFIELMDRTVKADALSRLLTMLVLPPETLLEQVRKWEMLNREYRKTFVKLLAVVLVPSEKLEIAKDEFEDYRKNYPG